MTKTVSLKEQVIEAAKALFMERGYESVGMRDIAKAVGRQPVQVYRLHLSKPDILAELIIKLNEEQIRQLPELLGRVEGDTGFERTCAYLRELYELDIRHKPIRSVGAAFGWMWSLEYERRVIGQIGELVKPVAEWLAGDGLDDVDARCLGIWSLYYVGYRTAVIHGGAAQECLAGIKPSLRYFWGSAQSCLPDMVKQGCSARL